MDYYCIFTPNGAHRIYAERWELEERDGIQYLLFVADNRYVARFNLRAICGFAENRFVCKD